MRCHAALKPTRLAALLSFASAAMFIFGVFSKRLWRSSLGGRSKNSRAQLAVCFSRRFLTFGRSGRYERAIVMCPDSLGNDLDSSAGIVSYLGAALLVSVAEFDALIREDIRISAIGYWARMLPNR